jgi:hypothetical protein
MNVRRRASAVTGVAVLAGGLAVGASVASSGTADAAVCTGGTLSTPCTMLGTAVLTGGVLTLISPTAIAWSATLGGSAQSVVDSLPTDTGYEVSDLTGSSAGWNVDASASPFTFVGVPSTGQLSSFPSSGTLVNAGSTTSESSVAVPSASCVLAPVGSLASCTVPTGTEPTYPVAITQAATSPTSYELYQAAVGSGSGLVQVGTSAATTTGNPSAWWVNVPANAAAGAYVSTITMTIASGP